MKFIENKSKISVNFTNNDEVQIGEMFIIDGTVFMKTRNGNNNIISYIDLSSGEEYYEFDVMQNFRGWAEAQKVDGELKWWKV